jgi:DNA modification methylase
MSFVIYQGDVLQELRKLPDSSVHCVVTSPPYWGLRDYGIEPSIWGGEGRCVHDWSDQLGVHRTGVDGDPTVGTARQGRDFHTSAGVSCLKCGAWRGCLGLEPTPDLFLEHIVLVFRQVRRVLHSSGTCWVNMGDCYVTKPQNDGTSFDPKYLDGRQRGKGNHCNRTDYPERDLGLKNKDLVMMPARVALALQADGWVLRDQIPWLKRSAMPGSQKDRPTTAVEYIFLFSKSESYFYDIEGARLASSGTAHARGNGVNPKAMGPNSRMVKDQDPDHQTKSKIRAKQNRSFSAAVHALVPSRVRRNSDWYFETMETLSPESKGMLLGEDGHPLGLLVNPQQFSIEMCGECKIIYEPAEYRKLPKVPVDAYERRKCACGSTSWISHFACFPEALVAPCVLLGTSEYGACHHCGAPYERVLDRATVGDWNPNKGRGHDKTAPACTTLMPSKRTREEEKRDPEGSQFHSARLNGAAKLADRVVRAGDKPHSISTARGAHDTCARPAPEHLGWRPTCDHPMFPPEPVPCVVLDPFGGSGRTLLATLKLGRHGVAIEKNPDYVRMIHHQVDCLTPEPAPLIAAFEFPSILEVAK